MKQAVDLQQPVWITPHIMHPSQRKSGPVLVSSTRRTRGIRDDRTLCRLVFGRLRTTIGAWSGGGASCACPNSYTYLRRIRVTALVASSGSDSLAEIRRDACES